MNSDLDLYSYKKFNDLIYLKSRWKMPGLFCLDLKKQQLRSIDEPLDLIHNWRPTDYVSCESVNKYVIFGPGESAFFEILNTEDDSIKCILKEGDGQYWTSVSDACNAYFISCDLYDLAVFDFDDCRITYPLRKCVSKDKYIVTGNAIIEKSEKRIVVASVENDELIFINTDTFEVKRESLPRLNIQYRRIWKLKDKYILSAVTPMLYVWDTLTIQTVKLDARYMRINMGSFISFIDAIVVDDKMYLAPYAYQSLISIDENNKIDYVYCIDDNEMCASISRFDNKLLISITDGPNIMLRNSWIDSHGVVKECDWFRINEDIHIKGANYEYSNEALNYFIGDICNVL